MKNKFFFIPLLVLLSSISNGQQAITYSFDRMDRIIEEKYPDSNTVKYTYDSAGNMKTKIIDNPCEKRPNPIVSVLGATTFCEGDSTILLSPLALGYLWSTGDTSINITVKSSGNYFVTTKGSLNCLKTSAPVIITVNSLPQPSIDTGFNTSFCPGLNTNLSSKLTGRYLWNTGDTVRSIIADTTRNYTLLFTDSNGCRATASMQITLFSKPKANFTINDSAQCLNANSFIFTNISSISTGAFSSKWIFQDNQEDTNFHTSRNYSSSGNQTIKLIVTSNNFCTDSFTKTVTIHPKPNPGFILPNPVQCLRGNSFSFTDTSRIAGGVISKRQWQFGDTTTGSLPNVNKAYNKADSFAVTLVLTSDKGCKDSIAKTVRVNPQVNLGFTVNSSNQCLSGNAYFFNDTTSVTGVNYTRNWQFGDGSSATVNPISKSFTSDSTYSILLTTVTNDGCIDSAQHLVVVYPQPKTGYVQNILTQCFNGNSFNLRDTSIIASGTITRKWDFGDGITSVDSIINKGYLASGAYYIKLVETSGFNCKDSVIKSFAVYPQTKIGFTINSSNQCLTNNLFQYTDTSIGNSSRIWHLGDGSNSSSNIAGITYIKDSRYNVKLITSTANNCRDTLEKSVQVYPMPKSGFAINNSGQCENTNNFVFTDTTKFIQDSYTRLWSYGDSTFSSDSIGSKHYDSAKTYNVKMIVTSSKGCMDSTYRTVLVYHKPTVDFNINDSTQCVNDNVFKFISLSSVLNASLTYKWTFGNDSVRIDSNVSIRYFQPGTYITKLVAISNFDCKDSISKPVSVYHKPNPVFTTNKDSQCVNANNYVFNSTTTIGQGTIGQHLWKFGDNKDTSSLSFGMAHKYDSSLTYMVTLVTISDFGCMDSISLPVYVMPKPRASFIVNNDSQCLNAQHFKFTGTSTVSSGFLRYYWKSSDGYSASDSLSLIHNYAASGNYSMRLINVSDFGCADTTLRTLIIHSKPKPDFTINDSTQCLSGNSYLFTNTSSIDNGTFSSQWKLPDTTSTNSIFAYTHKSTGFFNVVLVTKSNFNCSDSVKRIGQTYPMPAASFTINKDSQCLNTQNFVFSSSSIVSGGQIEKHFWRFGDSKDTTTPVFTMSHKYDSSGTFVAKLIVQSSISGCLDSALRTIAVHPKPIVKYYVNNSDQCQVGNLFNFKDSSSIINGTLGAYWSFGDNSTSGSRNPIKSYAKDSLYTIKLLSTSIFNCKDSVLGTVSVYPHPKANFIINKDSQCLKGNNFVFENTSSISSGNQFFKWHYGDGFPDTSKIGHHSYLKADVFSVMLISNSTYGCMDSITKFVSVEPMPVADFSIDKDSQCFIGNHFVLMDSTNIAGKIKWYLWDFGDGYKDSTANTTHSYDSAGTYNIRLLSISEFSCKDSITKKIKVFEQPKSDFAINDSAQCVNENNFIFTSLSLPKNSNLNHQWNLGNDTILSDSVFSFTFHKAGLYAINLHVTSAFGCSDSLVKLAIIHEKPNVDFIINDSTQCIIGNLFNFTNASTIDNGSFTSLWLFDDSSTTNKDSINKLYTVPKAYSILLTCVSNNNCIDSLRKKVWVYPNPPTPSITKSGNILISSADSGNQWYSNGKMITGAVLKQYEPTESGPYQVFVTNEFNCSMSSDTLHFILTGLSDMDEKFKLTIYPNPNEGSFTVYSTALIEALEFFDMVGRQVLSYPIKDYANELKLTLNVANGVYFIKVKTDSGTGLKRLVISR